MRRGLVPLGLAALLFYCSVEFLAVTDGRVVGYHQRYDGKAAADNQASVCKALATTRATPHDLHDNFEVAGAFRVSIIVVHCVAPDMSRLQNCLEIEINFLPSATPGRAPSRTTTRRSRPPPRRLKDVKKVTRQTMKQKKTVIDSSQNFRLANASISRAASSFLAVVSFSSYLLSRARCATRCTTNASNGRSWSRATRTALAPRTRTSRPILPRV